MLALHTYEKHMGEADIGQVSTVHYVILTSCNVMQATVWRSALVRSCHIAMSYCLPYHMPSLADFWNTMKIYHARVIFTVVVHRSLWPRCHLECDVLVSFQIIFVLYRWPCNMVYGSHDPVSCTSSFSWCDWLKKQAEWRWQTVGTCVMDWKPG